MSRMDKKLTGLPDFLNCDASKMQKVIAVLKWCMLFGRRNVSVGSDFTITKF